MNEDPPYIPGYRRPSHGRVILFSMFASAIVSASTTVAVLRWGPPVFKGAMASWSSGKTVSVQVPEVTSLPLSKAADVLAAYGLRLVVSGRRDADAPAETVIEQTPLSGSRVSPADPVALVVSTGAQGVVVPQLTGHTMDEARLALAVLGLKVGDIGHVQDGEAGVILAQDPASGTRVPIGNAVALSVGEAELIVMPDLSGLSIKRAQELLEGMGLVVGTVRERYDHRRRGNVVLEQEPSADTEVAAGSVVSLVINEDD